uniref:Uncharacterized protein n=1 Tax=Nymphaea colorata TaxID=210225 RepID=A0A5K1D5H2_9MAGN
MVPTKIPATMHATMVRAFVFRFDLVGQRRTWNIGAPQRAGFPLNESAFSFVNIPWFGISPSNWLKERSKKWRFLSDASDSGIVPSMELWERSMVSMATKLPKVGGIRPWKEFHEKLRV